ncbi:MAG: radical SAM protein, partial [Candidatus Omnitrophica bacterium]|nr:radical SAM protein [Candidatus Omnitrophota bacterium]
MGIISESRKFMGHLKTGGFTYVLYRGVLYLVFLVRRFLQSLTRNWKESLSKGKTQVVFSRTGASLSYSGCVVTRGSGLAAAVYAGGRWFNSDDAQWKILEKGRDFLRMRVKFYRLPVEQTWIVKLEEDQIVSWQIDMTVLSAVHIEEICVSCFLSCRYKNWICNYTERNFPAFTGRWQEVCVDNIPVSLLGVRFPSRNEFQPSVLLELEDPDGGMFPLVRTSSSQDASRVIGVRSTRFKALNHVPAGTYTVFSGKVGLYNDDSLLDNKMEILRKQSVKTRLEEINNRKSEKRLKVLLANLPWQRGGKWGVRAGSRWPHIKDEKESGYLPFPFFLAYAAALLHKHGYEAILIDAVAEQIQEHEFLERFVLKGFDYLVAETSIPSFEDDMRFLRRIAEFGIPIILAGPNTEIFQPSFLERHPFISFVMCGEYELTLLDLLRCIEEKKDFADVRGLVYRKDGTAIKNASRGHFSLDILPWPLRDTLPMEKYLDAPGGMRTPSVQMMASRGCPYRCQFCLWPQVMYQGHHYRVRNYIEVVDEMEFLVKEKGFKSVYFDDDTFNLGRERMLALCREIRKRGLHKTQWAIMARPDLMDEELLDNFKKAGLYAVKYGVESSAQPLVNDIGKGMDLKKTERMIRYTKKLGIKVHLT